MNQILLSLKVSVYAVISRLWAEGKLRKHSFRHHENKSELNSFTLDQIYPLSSVESRPASIYWSAWIPNKIDVIKNVAQPARMNYTVPFFWCEQADVSCWITNGLWANPPCFNINLYKNSWRQDLLQDHCFSFSTDIFVRMTHPVRIWMFLHIKYWGEGNVNMWNHSLILQ